MIPLLSYSYPYILLYKIPNDIYLGSACCLGLFLGAVALRVAYSFADNPKGWHIKETARAVYSMYILRVVAFLSLIAAVFLVGRIEYSMEREWYHPKSFNKGYWNIFRVVVAVLTPFTSGLFHTHCFFRFYSSFAFPALALVDMLSQIDLAGYIYCIEEGTCASISTHSIYLWMWRDMASIAINIFATTVSWFAWGQFGFCFNEIYMPRWEHRKLTTELNTMNINRRNVKRKLGDEDFVQW